MHSVAERVPFTFETGNPFSAQIGLSGASQAHKSYSPLCLGVKIEERFGHYALASASPRTFNRKRGLNPQWRATG